MNLDVSDLLVAIVATIVSIIFSYLLWGRKANQLNGLLIEEKKKEREESLKANLMAKIIKSSDEDGHLSYFYLEITNVGEVTACNIQLINNDKSSVEFENVYKFPLNLEVNQTTLVNMSIHEDSATFDLMWEDEFSPNRVKEYSLPII